MGPRKDDEITVTPKALAALFLTIITSPLLTALYAQYRTAPEAVRPDPFTGTEGRLMRDDLQRQIDENTKRIDAVRGNVNLCLEHLAEHARGRRE